MRRLLTFVACILCFPGVVEAQSLRGSPASLDLQNRVAHQHDFTYLSNPAQVKKFVDLNLLVPVPGNSSYRLHAVSFPYARPEAKLFIERLAAQYRNACGEKLVVTSLTRPRNRQPRNASSRSVHPTGMAIDLRRSRKASCRSWLERTLLSLENQGVLEATRENYPPHYHVTVFPAPYEQYVATLIKRAASPQVRLAAADTDAVAETTSDSYEVSSGDTLWGIARRAGVSVAELKAMNGLVSGDIYAGQVIAVPAAP